MAEEDFEDDIAEVEEESSDSSPAPKRSDDKGDKPARKESRPDSYLADVEEAVAQQRKKQGDPTPYRSGYGRAGKTQSEMWQFEQIAKKNGTIGGRRASERRSWILPPR